MAFDFSNLFPAVSRDFTNLQNNIAHPFAHLFGAGASSSADPWSGLRSATSPTDYRSPLHAAFGLMGSMSPQSSAPQAPAPTFGAPQGGALLAAITQLTKNRGY